jgi:hypothetical protein
MSTVRMVVGALRRTRTIWTSSGGSAFRRIMLAPAAELDLPEKAI